MHSVQIHITYKWMNHLVIFQNLYDAIFCIMYERVNHEYYPCFILFETNVIYNTNNQHDIYGKLWISNHAINTCYYSRFEPDINCIITKRAGKSQTISIMNLSQITCDDDFKSLDKKLEPISPYQPFIPQKEISYEDTLDILLKGKCCIGAE